VQALRLEGHRCDQPAQQLVLVVLEEWDPYVSLLAPLIKRLTFKQKRGLSLPGHDGLTTRRAGNRERDNCHGVRLTERALSGLLCSRFNASDSQDWATTGATTTMAEQAKSDRILSAEAQ
jgi:hypothetical protein